MTGGASNIALYAITANGKQLMASLQQRLGQGQCFALHGAKDSDAKGSESMSFKAVLAEQFAWFDCHICFCSVGIVTRLMAPLLKDKRQDPAVICIDEQGQFVVPVLSGHRGGANAMALRVAELLGAQAVLTTASDASQTLAVDLLGAAYGWRLDPACEPDLTQVSAAVVNGQALEFLVHSGHRKWWPHQRPWPSHWHWNTNLETEPSPSAQARIAISHRQSLPAFQGPTAIWRPKVLDLGVGCDRGTPANVVEQALEAFLQQHDLSPLSLRSLNSISLKADETGLIGTANRLKLPFDCFDAERLDGVEGIENPSATVKRCVGVSSVAEAASLYASQSPRLLAPKFKFKAQGFNVTLAACLHQGDALSPTAEPAHKGGKAMKPFDYHLILCGGHRCGDEVKPLASKLRRLAATELAGMGEGGADLRLKITRSYCIGGCRKGLRATLYCKSNQSDPNHGLVMQHLEQLNFDQWRQAFAALAQQQSITALWPAHQFDEEAPCA
ncbi:cobalamin biosynthesis protein [Ferrimonas aestuarii]|uniref:Cobalamin biosynthesis protein CbiG n=1 Tax=Ferrimonas aestuarii TaxID=2569539 RepID=A0A4U1BH43_9GAMM|nr:cobalamin biosynthesis protein [Ferrimonas aestuarii]TKB50054.1 cobalamin biosynthesis protein CbiG [Ferrimonas aestuarii]